MGWPLSQDYNEAVQSPRTVFADLDLKTGEVVPGPLGLPMPRSGNFADVYQVRGADGRMWALKCFTRPAAKLAERYRIIDAHLRDARLPFTVGFQFLPEGVRVRGQWYPALKMEWVEGLQLNEFVRQNIGRPDHLRAILGLWVRLCKRLRDAQIAHADLQHGNVLLVPGATANTLKLRLIDYDGMWVPALANNPSGEAGHPNFQHPARLRERVYSADVDRYPHLVIGCALRALAVAGKPLWDRFDNGDNLLFRETDFADPAKSKVFRALWEIDDPTVTNLVALLVLCGRRPLGDTPWLDEILSGDTAVPVRDALLAKAADLMGVPRRAARQALPMAQIYVVPEEANQFTNFGEWSRRRARRQSKLPVMIAGGVAMLAVALVVGLLLSRGNKSEPTTPTPPVVEVKGGTQSAERFGVVETKWVNFPSGPQAPSLRSVASGIDVAPPGSKIVRTYPVRGAAALGAWLQPDGLHAVLVGHAQVEVLDLATGQVRILPKPGGELIRATASPDGKLVVVGGKDKSVRCIDLATGTVTWTHKFPGSISAIAITPDGERVAVSGEKVGYMEWALADGADVRRHESLQAGLLAFSPDGAHAIAVNEGGVELWSMDEGKANVIGPGLAASAIAMTADGEQALATSVGREVKAWAVADGQALPERPSLVRQGVTALTATRDGTLLFGGQAGEIAYLGPDGTNALFTFGADSGPVVSFSIAADGRHALVASEKAGVVLTRLSDLVRPGGPLQTGPMVGSLQLVGSVVLQPDANRFAADAKGERLLVATPTHVRVYAGDKFTAGRPLAIPGGGIVSVGFGPDDSIVVCAAGADGITTRTYDPSGGNAGPAFAIPGVGGAESGRISRIIAVPEQDWVLATTDVAGDLLFDPKIGKVVTGWPSGRRKEPTIAAANKDGTLFAVASPTTPVKLWDPETGKADRPLEASVGVIALTFTTDGKRLIGLWPHGRIRVWDPSVAKLLMEVDHNESGPFTEMVGISPSVVALGPAPNRVLLNVDTGKALNTGDGPDPIAGRGLVVPARGWIGASDGDDRLTIWKVDPDSAPRLPSKKPRPSPWPDIKLVRDAPASPPVGLAYAPDGKTVVVATESGKLLRYTADRLLFVSEIEVEEAPLYGFAQTGEYLLTLGRRSLISVRNAETLEKRFDILSLAPGTAVPTLLAATGDATSILVMADKLRLADVSIKRETQLATLPKAAGTKPLTQFAFSADGKVGVGRWGNAATIVWHPRTGQPRVLEDQKAVPASPQSLALTPNGKVALLGNGNGKLTAWDTATGDVLFSKAIYPDAGPGEAIAAVAALADGSHFVTVGRDGRVIFWELEGFKQVKEFRGPEGPWRVAIEPSGRAAIMQQPGFIQRIDFPAVPTRKP
jgi:WD40 repeat protein